MKQLIINPGSTSTKIAVFDDENMIFEKTIRHTNEELSPFNRVSDQFQFRKDMIMSALRENNISLNELDAVVGRGGLIKPVEGGTYTVNDKLIEDLKKNVKVEHASNLGAFLADRFALYSSCPAFIVDPVSVDELTDVARISGAPEMKRSSLVHALNQKAVARKVAAHMGKRIEECRFVVAHLGTGITIGAHVDGKIVDVVGAKADGPFSPERAGGLPVGELIEFIFNGRYTREEIDKKLLSGWGLVAYLGTRDIRAAFEMAERDHEAKVVLEAMIYQIAKGIGEMSVVLDGDIDSIILTGGMAHSQKLVGMIKKKIKFLAPLTIMPGENEMDALFEGAERVLNGEELPRHYPTGEFVKL